MVSADQSATMCCPRNRFPTQLPRLCGIMTPATRSAQQRQASTGRPAAAPTAARWIRASIYRPWTTVPALADERTHSAATGVSSAVQRTKSSPGSTAISARAAMRQSSGAASTATASRYPVQAPASVSLITQWVPAGCTPSAVRTSTPVRPCPAITCRTVIR